ncbi:flagellar hook-length control protein FliK [Solibacillus sp. MA9]|uniref:Flagellar hook-length control protein FliK n=1 Tax=Solibacillus palustris TaxID=2908203 RepID=A0ABS9U9D2_9BACL|nr:flagellar hook-length control protein FliK [Solibacillus sp. MA9]MCH7320937.1 flagellar hook-length control protein FliK [Solibacillus sp. MA9]
MNIAMLQVMSANKVQQPTQKNAVEKGATESNTFGSVFKSMMSTNNSTETSSTTSTESLNNVEEIATTLATDSLEDLLAQLGIEMDEAGLFVFVGEEKMPVAMDEMLSLENLTEILGLTQEQLTEIIQQLVGQDTQLEITDIWSIIEQAPVILSEVMAALQGTQQSNIEPNEMEKVVQFLKLAELVGAKVDTVYQQEVQLSSLKDALLALANQAQQSVQAQQTPKTTFEQVVQQVTQQQSAQTTQQTTVKTETEQPTVGLQQQVTQTKTVTITLPAEKPAQSEALVKEIQNLINRSQVSGQQGNMKLFLKLFPENLGQIRIELVQKDGVLTARLLATTPLGKELLENNINQLKAGFVSQNIQMDRIDIAQSLQDADRNTRDQSFFNNFFGHQKEENKEQDNDSEEETISFKDLLSEGVE